MSLFGGVAANATLASLGIPPPEPVPRIMVSGWYLTPTSVIGTTAALTASSVHFTYFLVPAACSVNQILIEVTTAASLQNLRTGLYSVAADGSIGTLLADGGAQVSSGSTGIKAWTIASTALGMDWYAVGTVGSAAISLRSTGTIPLPTNVQASAFSNYGIRTSTATYSPANTMPTGPFASTALTTGNLAPMSALKIA